MSIHRYCIILLLFVTSLSSATGHKEHFASTTLVKGLPVIGNVLYYPNGNIDECHLGSEFEWAGNKFPVDTSVFPDSATGIIHVVSLGTETIIQGHLLLGGQNWQHSFYPSGKLELLWLARDEMIGGIPCASTSSLKEIFTNSARTLLYEDGQLKRCKLARPHTIDGVLYPKGTAMFLSPEGKVIRFKS